MLERILITFAIGGGLGLLWLAWHYYKAKTLYTIQPAGVTVGKPNLLYFTGPYCAACKFQQSPIVEAIAAKFGDAISIKQVDVSAHPDLASRYKVLTLPTTVVVDENGRITHINRGVAKQSQLETQLVT